MRELCVCELCGWVGGWVSRVSRGCVPWASVLGGTDGWCGWGAQGNGRVSFEQRFHCHCRPLTVAGTNLQVHAFKPNPKSHQQEAWRIMDFLSHHPESCHMLTFLLDDVGIPKSYRYMPGFGVHTFRWATPLEQPALGLGVGISPYHAAPPPHCMLTPIHQTSTHTHPHRTTQLIPTHPPLQAAEQGGQGDVCQVPLGSQARRAESAGC